MLTTPTYQQLPEVRDQKRDSQSRRNKKWPDLKGNHGTQSN